MPPVLPWLTADLESEVVMALTSKKADSFIEQKRLTAAIMQRLGFGKNRPLLGKPFGLSKTVDRDCSVSQGRMSEAKAKKKQKALQQAGRKAKLLKKTKIVARTKKRKSWEERATEQYWRDREANRP